MKLLKIKIFVFALLAFMACDTKNDFEGDYKNYFLKYYGEDGNQEAADFLIANDGVVILGTTRVGTQNRILLIKVDFNGNVLWERKLGALSENAKDIEATVDGQSYLILSNVFLGKDLTNNEDLFESKVIKVDMNGVKQDSAVYDEYSTQFMNSVTPLSNGGFFLTGNSTNENIFNEAISPPDQEDIVYAQYTSDFDWLASNGSTAGEHYGAAIKMFETTGGVRIFAYSDTEYSLPVPANSNHAVYPDAFAGGSWSTSYFLTGTNDNDEVLKQVIKDPFTNGYFELGTSSKLPKTSGNLYFARRTGDFSIINQGVVTGLSGNYTAVAVAPAPVTDDGYLLLAKETLIAGSNIKLVKLDQSCQYQWSVNFGSVSNQSDGAAVAELEDGRILVLGTIELETQKKIALIKLNSQGKFSD